MNYFLCFVLHLRYELPFHNELFRLVLSRKLKGTSCIYVLKLPLY